MNGSLPACRRAARGTEAVLAILTRIPVLVCPHTFLSLRLKSQVLYSILYSIRARVLYSTVLSLTVYFIDTVLVYLCTDKTMI